MKNCNTNKRRRQKKKKKKSTTNIIAITLSVYYRKTCDFNVSDVLNCAFLNTVTTLEKKL